jgi:hypothetical protein
MEDKALIAPTAWHPAQRFQSDSGFFQRLSKHLQQT